MEGSEAADLAGIGEQAAPNLVPPGAALAPMPPCENCGRPDCPTCGPAMGVAGAGGGYIYALGRIEARFPSLSVEKELAQATARAETASLKDRERIQKVLAATENAYIARQLCWVLTIDGMEAYVLTPRDASEVQELVAALRPEPSDTDTDVVIGTGGAPAPPSMCNGLQLPMVDWAQIYSFDLTGFTSSLPRPEGVSEEQFSATVERVLELADNPGASDQHRALNYLSTRYADIYARVALREADGASLSEVTVRPSPHAGGGRRVVDVIFSFRDRRSGVVDKEFVRVDITELFPFLVREVAPYYDR